MVIECDEKQVTVVVNDHPTLFSIDRCKPFIPRPTTDETERNQNLVDNPDTPDASNRNPRHSDDENVFDPSVLDYNHEQDSSGWNPSFEDDEMQRLFDTLAVTEVKNDDPRAREPDFLEAKTREIRGLEKRMV